MANITKGIVKITKPESVQVFIPNNQTPSLAVVENGNTRLLPISKRVAEVLISKGFPYGN